MSEELLRCPRCKSFPHNHSGEYHALECSCWQTVPFCSTRDIARQVWNLWVKLETEEANIWELCYCANGKARMITHEAGGTFYASCFICGMSGPRKDTKESARDEWNRIQRKLKA